ncbi:MKL/myocardin-like protein 1 [Seriola dumerili]|uniref:MKL/myocardin-like protein 1 n=1 Tax=Seriola dumerili TaxID=41447 RepID=UPI000BBEA1CC|nr:MKL/myocardin-like protein 1 [Seriola dumerili]
MPPLKSSAAFHEQRRSLERARTEDYLKRKIRSRPERSELIRMHILEETSAEPSLQAKQLQLKRARIADDLNDKISHRPGPMELIHKNILPVHSSIKQAIIETRFPKASGDNSSCDEDSNDSLSPEQPGGRESPLGQAPLPSPPETVAGSGVPSPAQAPPPAPSLPPLSGSSPSLTLTNGTATPSVQKMGATSQMKSQPKPTSERSAQRHKKPKDNKPKIKKLKYHQYIPPDQKGDKEPLPHLDSPYAKILQQQQLFLQLQILSQQQQHYNYQAILPAPPSSSSSSNSTTASSPPRPLAAPSASASAQSVHSHQSSAPPAGTKPVSLPPNLDELKVVELKCQLKLRSLPVSGTKNDLIERLRTYQELNRGGDTTPSPTAGGAAGPGAEAAGRSSKSAASSSISSSSNNNNTAQQFEFQCRRTSSLTADEGSGGTPPVATPQQLMTCGGAASPPPVSLALSDRPPAAISPADPGFTGDPLGETMSSPLTQLSLQPRSAARLPANIKEERPCSTPAPCQFSLQKHRAVSSAAPTATTTAPLLTIDKDKMLQEKDKQIEELTRMLRQKQRLVELLRMQLELGKRGGRVSEPVVLVRVKQEPPDKPSVSLSSGRPPSSPQTSSSSCDMDATKVTVKQEATETEEVVCESLDSRGLPRSYSQTQEAREQIQLHIKPQTKQEQRVCLQQTALQLAQQQAIQKLLLQQQHNIHNQQQNRNQCVNQQSASAPSFPLDLLKTDSTPALVRDSNGNHFLIALTNHITENQSPDAPEGKATNHITLQRLQSTPAKLPGHNPVQLLKADDQSKQSVLMGFQKQQNTKAQSGGLHVSVDQPQQEAAQCLSAPPSLQPFFQDQDSAPSGKNTSSPSSQTTGELSTSFTPAPDPSLDRLNPNSSAPSPPPSPLQLLLSPPIPPSCDTPLPAPPLQSELQTLVATTEEKQHLSNPGSGRLEDFLESTTGKPLLGVEPGGLLTLIDDLHSQMLCTPSILDHPPSPMDTFSMDAEGEQGLDSMDWLDLTMGRAREEEPPTLAPLGPQTPPSVFSTDFLESYDMQIHWDSCL